jgi:hypothetical protein
MLRGPMNVAGLQPFIDRRFDEDLLPRLVDYVRVPAKSPSFDIVTRVPG